MWLHTFLDMFNLYLKWFLHDHSVCRPQMLSMQLNQNFCFRLRQKLSHSTKTPFMTFLYTSGYNYWPWVCQCVNIAYITILPWEVNANRLYYVLTALKKGVNFLKSRCECDTCCPMDNDNHKLMGICVLTTELRWHCRIMKTHTHKINWPSSYHA